MLAAKYNTHAWFVVKLTYEQQRRARESLVLNALFGSLLGERGLFMD